MSLKITLSSKPLLASTVSGLVAGLSFSIGGSLLLTPIAIGIFLWLFLEPSKKLSLKDSLAVTALFFFGFFGFLLQWVFSVNSSLMTGTKPGQSLLYIGGSWLLITSILTLICLPFGVLCYALQNRLKKPALWSLLVLMAGWVVTEWARSLAISMFLYGSGGSIGDYWNFGSLGLAVISSPVGILSRTIGMYGLSALVIGLAVCTIWAAQKNYKPVTALLVIAVVLGFASYLPYARGAAKPKLQVSVLQRTGEIDDLSSSYAAIRNKNNSPKDLILLSEYSSVTRPENSRLNSRYVLNRLSQDGVSIDVTKTPDRYNLMEVRNKKNRITQSQTKQLLIPFGEYMPTVFSSILANTGQQNMLNKFDSSKRLSKGQPPQVVAVGEVMVAPVACSGILGKDIYRQLTLKGGQVLTNSASLVTFGGSRAYFRQTAQMARFHAIANNRPYIQATIGAPAFALDNNGRYVVKPQGSRTEFIDFSITPQSQKTVYTRFGDWPLKLSGLIILAFVLLLVITVL